MRVAVEGILSHEINVPDDVWRLAKEEEKAGDLVLSILEKTSEDSAKVNIVFYEMDEEEGDVSS